jgi:hypothetical protein
MELFQAVITAKTASQLRALKRFKLDLKDRTAHQREDTFEYEVIFKMLFSAYVQIWGIDYLQMAAATIRQVLGARVACPLLPMVHFSNPLVEMRI